MRTRKPETKENAGDEPPCYSCISAIRRGPFRLCKDGEEGYKHIGVWKPCSKQKPIEE